MVTTHPSSDVREPGDIARLLARDEAAWRALHEREFDVLYRFARAMGADPDLAEDCASEAFARLVRKLDGLRFDSLEAIRGWLMVVTRNHLRDQLRRRRSDPIETVAHLATELDPHTRLELARALAALPQQQREVLVMRFSLRMTTDEVAAAIGKGAKAVESLQHRGLESLRRSPLLRELAR